jgi:predicted DNA-binding antitoxin AbrB/MazE fold protein
MTATLNAIYENGKLVLLSPLPLPEKSHVRVTVETEDNGMSDAERSAWLKVSEQSLMRTWSGVEDDVFNELLKK